MANSINEADFILRREKLVVGPGSSPTRLPGGWAGAYIFIGGLDYSPVA